ncbi:MAG: hypothetical protein AB7O96_09985 [Pseudobdellovibrionaceae bacterium]
MDKYSDLIYKLLHKRKYRELFLEERYSQMQLDADTLDCVSTISKDDLVRSSQKIVLNVYSYLGKMNEEILKEWIQMFPDDPEGIELIYLFLESKEYSSSANFAIVAGDQNISQEFTLFFARVRLKLASL